MKVGIERRDGEEGMTRKLGNIWLRRAREDEGARAPRWRSVGMSNRLYHHCWHMRKARAGGREKMTDLPWPSEDDYRRANEIKELRIEVERLRPALRNLITLIEEAWRRNRSLFDNGVIHEGRDEGDVIAGQYLDEARAALGEMG